MPRICKLSKEMYNYKKHRVIMSAHLERELHKDEIVHHLNGVHTDNRFENLQLMSNKGHAKIHWLGLRAERDNQGEFTGIRLRVIGSYHV